MYTFREATENDFDGISKLIESKEDLFLVYPKGSYPFTISQVQILAQTRKELTVIIHESKVIGFANFYNYKPSESVFVGNVILNKTYRGKGLGKDIVSYMLNLACDKYKLPEVRVSVFGDNSPALLLYSGFGFVPYAMEERKNMFGNRVALIHMKRSF